MKRISALLLLPLAVTFGLGNPARADLRCSARPSITFSPAIEISATAGIAGVQLLTGASNVQLGTPTALLAPTIQVTPVNPALPGQAVVEITDLAFQTCRVGVSFTPIEPGVLIDQTICKLDGFSSSFPAAGNSVTELTLGLTSEQASGGGHAECAVNLAPAPADEPSLPTGFVFACPTATVRLPVVGDVTVSYDFESDQPLTPDVWLLLSVLDEPLPVENPLFGDFEEVTDSHAPACSEILLGKGNALGQPMLGAGPAPANPLEAQIKAVCARLAPNCSNPQLAGLDDDLDTFPLCSGGFQVDCNDQNDQIHPGLTTLDDATTCNGLDDDCSGVVDEINNDGDLLSDCFDCNSTNPNSWLIRDIRNVVLTHVGSTTTLSWFADDCDGSTTGVVYDTLLSRVRDDFTAASCIVTGSSNTFANHLGNPAPGQVLYFLVVARHPAPGVCATAGFDSSGAPRAFFACN